jgi:hypothetical protein
MAGKGNDSAPVNSEATWIVGTLVIGATLFLIWYGQRQLIVYPMFALKWVQVMVYDLTVGLPEAGQRYLDFIQSYFDGRRQASRIYWEEFVDVNQTVGNVMALPMAGLIMCVALVVFTRMKGDNFKRQMGLVPLIHYQSKHWRTLTTSARFDPDKASDNMRPSLRPLEFLHSLKLKGRLTDKGSLPEDAHTTLERAFAKQLGSPWKPVPKLALHERCLVAMFACHNSKKTPVALKLRQDIDVAYNMPAGKKRDAHLESLIAEILADEKAMAPILAKAEKHAFVSTALISVLKMVREEKGVLASADFLWLKEVDRTLWYVLNNVGRRAFHVECAGVWSHYFHENIMARPILEPKVSGAVDGLEKYLDEQGIDEPI